MNKKKNTATSDPRIKESIRYDILCLMRGLKYLPQHPIWPTTTMNFKR